MKLGEWLLEQGMTQAALAKLMLSDQGHVSDLVNEKVRPTLPTIDVLHTITKGKVSWPDWRPVPKKGGKKNERST